MKHFCKIAIVLVLIVLVVGGCVGKPVAFNVSSVKEGRIFYTTVADGVQTVQLEQTEAQKLTELILNATSQMEQQTFPGFGSESGTNPYTVNFYSDSGQVLSYGIGAVRQGWWIVPSLSKDEATGFYQTGEPEAYPEPLTALITSLQAYFREKIQYPYCPFDHQNLQAIFSMKPEGYAEQYNSSVEQVSSTYYAFACDQSVQINGEEWLLGFNTAEDGTICDVVLAHSWHDMETEEQPKHMTHSEKPLEQSLRVWFEAEDAIRAVGTVDESYPHLPKDVQVSDDLVEETMQKIATFSMTSFGPYLLEEGLWVSGNHQYISSTAMTNGWVVITFSNYDRYAGRGLND